MHGFENTALASHVMRLWWYWPKWRTAQRKLEITEAQQIGQV
jgi:hypothetical protein